MRRAPRSSSPVVDVEGERGEWEDNDDAEVVHAEQGWTPCSAVGTQEGWTPSTDVHPAVMHTQQGCTPSRAVPLTASSTPPSRSQHAPLDPTDPMRASCTGSSPPHPIPSHPQHCRDLTLNKCFLLVGACSKTSVCPEDTCEAHPMLWASTAPSGCVEHPPPTPPGGRSQGRSGSGAARDCRNHRGLLSALL